MVAPAKQSPFWLVARHNWHAQDPVKIAEAQAAIEEKLRQYRLYRIELRKSRECVLLAIGYGIINSGAELFGARGASSFWAFLSAVMSTFCVIHVLRAVRHKRLT